MLHENMPAFVLSHTWSMDFAGLLPHTRLKSLCIIIAVKCLKICLFALPLADNVFNSTNVLHFLEKEVTTTFAHPVSIMSDNDSKLNSERKRRLSTASICQRIYVEIVQK